MARPDFALVCKAATDEGGLFNMLGAGVTSVGLPQFPALLQFHIAARFYWSQEETGRAQVLAVRVEHVDGERVLSIDSNIVPVQTQPDEPDERRAQLILLPLTMDIRRAGGYFVRVYVNGDVLMESPLAISSQMPPV